jgi:hypothetical protein
MRDSVRQLRAVFFFRSRLTLPEGEGRFADRNLAATVSGRPSHQPLILFIALPEAEDNLDPG